MTYLHCHMLQCYYAIWVRLKRSGANICTMEWGLLNTNSFHKGTLYTSIDNHALKISLFQIRRHQSWAVKLCVGCRSTINSVWKFCLFFLTEVWGSMSCSVWCTILCSIYWILFLSTEWSPYLLSNNCKSISYQCIHLNPVRRQSI